MQPDTFTHSLAQMTIYSPHHAAGWRETWEDGQAFDELNTRLRVIADQKEAIAAAQKVLLNPIHALQLVLLTQAEVSFC